MRVNLRFRFYAAVHQTKCRDSPIKIIVFPVGFSQRKLFTQRRLVNLNNAYAVCFEVKDFFTNCESDLIRAFFKRNVLPRERPVQNCNRTCKHSFHRLFSKALRIYRPFNSHWLCSGNVAPYNRRFHTASAVGLHPSFFCEYISVKAFAEIFNHIVSFKLAVNENVKTDFLL